MSIRSREQLPIDSDGNGHRMRSLQFDAADALMIAHALLIGANTAMMTPSCIGTAEQRLRFYRQQFLDLCHPGAKHFDADEAIAEIAIAMAPAPTWSIQRVKPYSWSTEFSAVVRVGDHAWSTWRVNETQLAEMIEAIEQIAPLSCTKEEIEDKLER